MENFNDLFASEYHQGIFIKFYEFCGNSYYSFIPEYEITVHLKTWAPNFSDLDNQTLNLLSLNFKNVLFLAFYSKTELTLRHSIDLS